jgi:metal-responsive CopG/Arc/MetJ family transcriptional regulator
MHVRVDLSMPDTVLGWIDRAADREGKARSAFLIEAAREHVVRQGLAPLPTLLPRPTASPGS